jgi:hypothetical protein
MRRDFAIGVALLILVGCDRGNSENGGSTPPDEGGEEPVEVGDARALGATATFSDLVAAVRRVDDRNEPESTAGCLLRGGDGVGAPFRLEADVAVAVRPVGDAPGELARRLEAHDGGVRLLSRWGQQGEDPAMAVMTLTSTPPPTGAPSVVAIVTDLGVHLRSTAGPLPAAARGPFAAGDLAARLAAAPSEAPSVIVVTADAGISLGRVRSVLAALPDGAPVALGVMLAENTRLPDEPPRPEAETDGLCPDGLPEPGDGPIEGHFGEGGLSPEALLGALGPFREAATDCLGAATGAAAAGGRLIVVFRVGADGRIAEACVRTDEIGDAGVRRCVLDALRPATFPQPDPAGTVDVSLPVVLRPDASLRQRPLCDQ